jgi:diphthine-ammonia ligase
MKLAALFTGGKDSVYAIHLAKQEHQVVCLITIKSSNPDSYMFHTPAIELTSLQAKAMNLPILFFDTKGEKEKELEDLEQAIVKAKEKYDFEGIITGALFSEYQSSRIGKICDKLGLVAVSPLWQKSQEKEMEELIDGGFKFILTSIAGDGLDKSWLGRVITLEDLDKLKEINQKIGTNVAGEGGEFESLVVNCPLFEKELIILDSEILEENKYTARLLIKKARLE